MIENPLCQATTVPTKLLVDALKEGALYVKSGAPYFAIPCLLTLIVTIFLCHWRMARRNPFFFVTAVTAAILVNLVFWLAWFLVVQFQRYGWGVFTAEAWRWRPGMKNGMASALFWGRLAVELSSLICILPALVVAWYYERRHKKLRPAGREPQPNHFSYPHPVQS